MINIHTAEENEAEARAHIRVYTSVYTRARDPLFGGKERHHELYTPKLYTWENFAKLLQDRVFRNPQATVTNSYLQTKNAWKIAKLSQRVSVFSLPKPGRSVFALVFDYDNIDTAETYSKLLDCVATSQYECLIHTTSSHTEFNPKLHLIFPLEESITCSDICSCLCTLIKQLELPTCFDSSVFIPGQALYLPEERVADGFCEWHRHDMSGATLPKFTFKSCGSIKERRSAVKSYGKFIGAAVSQLDTYEQPQMRLDAELRKDAALRRIARHSTDYFHTRKYADVDDRTKAKLTKALDKLHTYVTQAIYVAQHDYALEYLRSQQGFADVDEYRNSSSLYSTNKKRLLLLAMPCPKCAAIGKHRMMFGSCYLDSGYARMHCVSQSCKHQIQHKNYDSKSNLYQIDSVRFWQVMLEQLQASIVCLNNSSVRFISVGNTLVPVDLFCSTLYMSFQNAYRIRQAASVLPQCPVEVSKKQSIKVCLKKNISKLISLTPLLDNTKKITNGNIFVVNGNKPDFIYRRLLSGYLFPLFISKMSGSTFATKKRLSVEALVKALGIASRPGTTDAERAGHIPDVVRNIFDNGGITMLSPFVILSKLRRLPPAVFVVVENHRSGEELAKIRQRCMIAALRGTKVFIIPKITKGGFFTPAYRVCKLLNIRQTQVRSLRSCIKLLDIPKSIEKIIGEQARAHYISTQDVRLKILKKVNKPQKQDIEGTSQDGNNVVLDTKTVAASTNVGPKSHANATTWSSIVIDV